MSIHTQYIDNVRESKANWDRGVDVFTDNAKTILGQVQQTVATTLQADPTDGLFDYLRRTLDAQGELSKQFAALSADFSERILVQSEALASAARDYAGTAQELLRDQAGKQYDEFAAARQRAEDAVRQVPTPAKAKRATKADAASE